MSSRDESIQEILGQKKWTVTSLRQFIKDNYDKKYLRCWRMDRNGKRKRDNKKKRELIDTVIALERIKQRCNVVVYDSELLQNFLSGKPTVDECDLAKFDFKDAESHPMSIDDDDDGLNFDPNVSNPESDSKENEMEIDDDRPPGKRSRKRKRKRSASSIDSESSSPRKKTTAAVKLKKYIQLLRKQGKIIKDEEMMWKSMLADLKQKGILNRKTEKKIKIKIKALELIKVLKEAYKAKNVSIRSRAEHNILREELNKETRFEPQFSLKQVQSFPEKVNEQFRALRKRTHGNQLFNIFSWTKIEERLYKKAIENVLESMISETTETDSTPSSSTIPTQLGSISLKISKYLDMLDGEHIINDRSDDDIVPRLMRLSEIEGEGKKFHIEQYKYDRNYIIKRRKDNVNVWDEVIKAMEPCRQAALAHGKYEIKRLKNVSSTDVICNIYDLRIWHMYFKLVTKLFDKLENASEGDSQEADLLFLHFQNAKETLYKYTWRILKEYNVDGLGDILWVNTELERKRYAFQVIMLGEERASYTPGILRWAPAMITARLGIHPLQTIGSIAGPFQLQNVMYRLPGLQTISGTISSIGSSIGSYISGVSGLVWSALTLTNAYYFALIYIMYLTYRVVTRDKQQSMAEAAGSSISGTASYVAMPFKAFYKAVKGQFDNFITASRDEQFHKLAGVLFLCTLIFGLRNPVFDYGAPELFAGASLLLKSWTEFISGLATPVQTLMRILASSLGLEKPNDSFVFQVTGLFVQLDLNNRLKQMMGSQAEFLWTWYTRFSFVASWAGLGGNLTTPTPNGEHSFIHQTYFTIGLYHDVFKSWIPSFVVKPLKYIIDATRPFLYNRQRSAAQVSAFGLDSVFRITLHQTRKAVGWLFSSWTSSEDAKRSASRGSDMNIIDLVLNRLVQGVDYIGNLAEDAGVISPMVQACIRVHIVRRWLLKKKDMRTLFKIANEAKIGIITGLYRDVDWLVNAGKQMISRAKTEALAVPGRARAVSGAIKSAVVSGRERVSAAMRTIPGKVDSVVAEMSRHPSVLMPFVRIAGRKIEIAARAVVSGVQNRVLKLNAKYAPCKIEGLRLWGQQCSRIQNLYTVIKKELRVVNRNDTERFEVLLAEYKKQMIQRYIEICVRAGSFPGFAGIMKEVVKDRIHAYQQSKMFFCVGDCLCERPFTELKHLCIEASGESKDAPSGTPDGEAAGAAAASSPMARDRQTTIVNDEKSEGAGQQMDSPATLQGIQGLCKDCADEYKEAFETVCKNQKKQAVEFRTQAVQIVEPLPERKIRR